jgi:cyclopropane fatty-acyl-phospholipid synthase-like methyltransferase
MRMAETIDNERDWHAYWNSVNERIPAGDFFRQVDRTVLGRPMDKLQIALVADVARAALDLGPGDRLLDLCCGNGMVTVVLAAACESVYGVDYSRDLIDVARRHHAAPNISYLHRDATELTAAGLGDWQPNKVSMISGIQFFTITKLTRLLAAVAALTDRAAPLFVADVPDVDHIHEFYDTPERWAYYERQRAIGAEPMGTWWNRRDLAEVLLSGGYSTEFMEHKAPRFGAYYHRFDLLARPVL